MFYRTMRILLVAARNLCNSAHNAQNLGRLFGPFSAIFMGMSARLRIFSDNFAIISDAQSLGVV